MSEKNKKNDKRKILTLKEKFDNRVDKSAGPDACWLWTGVITSKGYGHMLISTGKLASSHRVSYQLYVGEIPDDLQVCHACDNPACVNPSHLFLGTAKDNAQDRERKGRGVTPPASGRKGSQNFNSKLNEGQVIEIRKRFAEGGISKSALAREYGVGQPMIYRIVIRQLWTHI